MSDVAGMVRGFLAAQRANAPYEPPSAHRTLDVDEAYVVQRAFNDLRAPDDPIVGFKSAANAEALQRALALSEPIVGVLFSSGQRRSDAAIRRADFRSLLVETEVGFRATQRIDSAPAGTAALRAAFTEALPMIELADPGFGRARMTGTDLIAGNAASAGFLGGSGQSSARVDVNAVHVRLERDGTLLHEARAGDLMGDQWRALRWLVDRVIDLGYVIEPGHVLMTGSLGPAHPGAAGHYRADFSALGTLEFDVI